MCAALFAASPPLPRWAEDLIRARFLVAALGETAAPPWWRSQATAPVAFRMLARVFPRTAVVACLETSTRAAQREHDLHIAHRGAFHLFRLPPGHEALIYESLQQEQTRNELAALLGLDGRVERLAALKDLARSEISAEGEGPIACGPVSGLQKADLLRRIAATYLAAFEGEIQRFPYLEA